MPRGKLRRILIVIARENSVAFQAIDCHVRHTVEVRGELLLQVLDVFDQILICELS